MDLRDRDAWIFDLDGTLTVAVHDFDAIRAELGLPMGRPILEALDELPAAAAAQAHARLYELELTLARASRPSPGAEPLLAALAARGRGLGVVTRNSRQLALITLEACGLSHFIPAQMVRGREDGPPKPSPAGVTDVLQLLGVPPERAVMVGDYQFDLMAGRAAGAATVWLDLEGSGQFRHLCDRVVTSLEQLHAELSG